MSNQLVKISDLKIFGISPLRVFSDCAGQPLLEVPLHQETLNLIGDTFQTFDDLATLGQLCGTVLKLLNGNSVMRREVLRLGEDFSGREKLSARYSEQNVSLVILLHSQCVGIEA